MIELVPLDAVWMRVNCDEAIARELHEYFSFDVPAAKFMRRQARFRRWDGKVHLFKLSTRTLCRGLVSRVYEFAEGREYEVVNRLPNAEPVLPGTELDAALQSLDLPFDVRDYQYTAVREALDTHRRTILSPTGSGKTYILYLLAQLLPAKKLLIVVPTIGLISQIAKDFKEYGFDLNDLHTIQAGSTKHANARLYISTWQSIFQMPEAYFTDFEAVICDECHLAKAASLTSLFAKCRNAEYRFGFTGTLDNTQVHQLQIEGLFGPVIRVTTTKDLVSQGMLAPLRIKLVTLRYSDAECKQMVGAVYPDEVDFLVGHRARLEFIAQLAARTEGNTLVLFNLLEKHGVPLYDRVRTLCEGKKDVHYVAGSVDGHERESIRVHVEEHPDKQVIVASYGTFSTGINLTNLHHLIFAAPSKSKIRVLQSIGRTLRTHAEKTHATLWDIADDLRWGKRVNFALRHAEDRMRYYTAEKFPVALTTLSLDAFTLRTPTSQGNVLVDAPGDERQHD